MRPVVTVVDEFFRNVHPIRETVLLGEFSDVPSPYDGVVYPNINANIDPNVSALFILGLNKVIGPILAKTIFARATALNKTSPHRVHSDEIMGKFAAHVYLSSEPDSGTAFWSHPVLGSRNVTNSDPRGVEGWKQELFIPSKLNRLLIHDTSLWHSAEPPQGWGDSPATGRLVLTCFFDLLGQGVP